jgi:sugar phosphate isomerase/epimerase
MRIGLKVWSLNRQYVEPARQLFAAGMFDFIELYIHPSTTDADRDVWAGVCPDTRLHAPHSFDGFNPARPEMFHSNCEQIKMVDSFRKAFSPRSIVFHPGVDGTIEESLRQFAFFRSLCPEIFGAALIENKPAVGLRDEACIGASPAEIRMLMGTVRMGFCFDLGHALCYAAQSRRPCAEVVGEFLGLRPELFHVSDGMTASLKDRHQHLGRGDFDLKALLARVPDGSSVLIESPHDFQDRLDDFARDVEHLKKVIGS